MATLPEIPAATQAHLRDARSAIPALSTGRWPAGGDVTEARLLAHTLGNRRFSQLALSNAAVQRTLDLAAKTSAYGHSPEEHAASADRGPLPEVRQVVEAQIVLRAPGAGNLSVSLTFRPSATEYYQVNGATMEEVDAQLPETLGEFHHSVPYDMATYTSPEGETTVTGVRLPVDYYYVMPEWTQLQQQPARVRQAWRRFYNDLMKHEREHLTVSRREYASLRASLRALPEEERTEAGVGTMIDEAIVAQNEIHESHTGFVTPSTLVFSDYIPSQ